MTLPNGACHVGRGLELRYSTLLNDHHTNRNLLVTIFDGFFFIMVILARVPGLEVEIVDCDHQPLNEHESDENEQSQDAEEDLQTNETTRYIESKSGAKFGIRTTFSEAFGTEYGVRMEVRIDGLAARKIILGPADLHAHGGQYVCSYKHEYRNLKRYRRDFQFADLEVGEYTLSSALTRAQSCRGDVR